ncbi:MAG: 50S ribosomal protein L3 [Candidatus Paceibacterota bacterium]
MKYIVGEKGRMTQVFDESGIVHPATVLSVVPNAITQVKNIDKDGYSAVQVGYGTKKKINKPLSGHLKGKGSFRGLKEFRIESEIPEEGAVIDVSIFEPGDVVSVSALSKGKGFQGVVKRYNFGGGPRTHGQKHTERAPGSIGGGGRAGGRVVKGQKMPGRMGQDRVTVKNLKVLQVNKEEGTIVIRGAIPGRPGTLVEIVSK